MWMRPPATGNTRNPSSHSTNKIRAIVQSIF
jgi:hypothetical protein